MVQRYFSKPPTTRQMRVSELIRSLLSDMIFRGDIPHISPLDLTISSVSVSPDLRYSTVYIIPCTSKTGKKPKPVEKIIANLHNSRKLVKQHIAHEMTSRICPDIEFVKDDGIDNAMKIEKILHHI